MQIQLKVTVDKDDFLGIEKKNPFVCVTETQFNDTETVESVCAE